jgi:ketosteroid isomerase-like protein
MNRKQAVGVIIVGLALGLSSCADKDRLSGFEGASGQSAGPASAGRQAAGSSDAASDLRSLVEAELAFAKLSEASGIKDAFAANLADEAIVFRPLPVEGKPIYRDMPPSEALLTWFPVWADVSAAGDLGYTTGPYENYKSKAEKTAARRGHYVTLWRRQPDRSWRAVLDAGIPHGPLPDVPAAFSPGGAPALRPDVRVVDVAAEEKTLRDLESRLSDEASRRSEADVLLEVSAENVRVYRAGSLPAVGNEKARALLPADPARHSWAPMKTVVASSGDLGYAYGLAGEASYLRIWKKNGGVWTIVLDLEIPIPPEEKK